MANRKVELTQFKIWVKPDLVQALRYHCAQLDVSMSYAVSNLIASFVAIPVPERSHLELPVATRKDRRRAISLVMEVVQRVQKAEQTFLDHIPDNLQCGFWASEASDTIERLDDILDALKDVFQ